MATYNTEDLKNALVNYKASKVPETQGSLSYDPKALASAAKNYGSSPQSASLSLGGYNANDLKAAAQNYPKNRFNAFVSGIQSAESWQTPEKMNEIISLVESEKASNIFGLGESDYDDILSFLNDRRDFYSKHASAEEYLAGPVNEQTEYAKVLGEYMSRPDYLTVLSQFKKGLETYGDDFHEHRLSKTPEGDAGGWDENYMLVNKYATKGAEQTLGKLQDMTDEELKFKMEGGLTADYRLTTDMLDAERDVYNYIRETDGVNAANAFLDNYVKPRIQAGIDQEVYEKDKALAEENPVAAYILAYGNKLMLEPVQGAANMIIQKADPDAYRENATALERNIQQTGIIRQTQADNLGGAWKHVYTIGTGVADLAGQVAMSKGLATYASALGAVDKVSKLKKTIDLSNKGKNAAYYYIDQAAKDRIAGWAMMSMNASTVMGETLSNARQRGLSDTQMSVEALGMAAIEALTEKIGLDELMRADGSVIRSALAEGFEEGLSALGGTILDAVVAGDKSEWQASIKKYIDSGKSEKDAVMLALRDTAGDVMYEAAIGALVGGTFKGSQALIGKISSGSSNIVKSPINVKPKTEVTKSNASKLISKWGGVSMVKEGVGRVNADSASLLAAVDAAQTGQEAAAVASVRRAVQKGVVVSDDTPQGILLRAAMSAMPGDVVLTSVVKMHDKSKAVHGVAVRLSPSSYGEYDVTGILLDGDVMMDLTQVESQPFTSEQSADIQQRIDEAEGMDTTERKPLETADGVLRQPTQEQTTASNTGEQLDSFARDFSTEIGVTPSEADLAFKRMPAAKRKKLYTALESHTGVKIVEDYSLTTDGEYDPAIKTIRINPNKATPLTVIKHELTHYLESSGILYQDFMNYAFEKSDAFKQWLKSKGQTLDGMRQEIARRYAEKGVTLNTESGASADQEILANFAAEVLFKDINALVELGQKNRTLFQRLKHFVTRIINKIRGVTPDPDLDRLERMFNKALAASQNTAATKTDVTKSFIAPEDSSSEQVDSRPISQWSEEEMMAEIARRKPKQNPNPLQAAQLKPEDAITTPQLPQGGKRNVKGDGESAFAQSVQDSGIFSDELKALSANDRNITRYDTVTNLETMEEANNKINEGGKAFIEEFEKRDSSTYTTEDMAIALILISRYEAVGDHTSAMNLMGKLREAGTKHGQAVQILSLLSRLTPDGMVMYAQKELSEAYEKLVDGKTQKWIKENQWRFDLTDKEIDFIRRRTWQAAQLPKGRDRDIRLAEIASLVQSKIPQEKGQAYKAWQRTAMLLNPKTQLRNVLGNATMIPAFLGSDFFGSVLDKYISKKTGVRTTGALPSKKALEGIRKGLFESFDDFVRHINTRGLGQDRFEIESRSLDNFNEHHTGFAAEPKNKLSKALNALDRFNSFLLDAGDRPFYEMWFINSLNTQMLLNGVSEPTGDMIEIATLDAMQRTWQDSNKVVETFSKTKNLLNAKTINGYGLGDALIKFVKTPANLTKAVFDFSPLGLARSFVNYAVEFQTALKQGKATPQMQRRIVKDFGNGIVGTLLTIVGYFLAKSGRTTGKEDEDNDVAAFERDVLGYKPFSFKIGNMSFTYDWMQPIGPAFAAMANYFQDEREAELTGEKKSLYEKLMGAFSSGWDVLYDQSFMKSIQILFEDDGIVTNVTNALLNDLNAPIPQLFSQIAASIDPNVRTTYESGRPVQTAINKVLYKIPFARETLPESVDVLGNERVQFENDAARTLQSFFNPANVGVGYDSKGGKEMYRVYQETGSSSAIPPLAPSYVEKKGGKYTLTSEEKAKYQKITGEISEKSAEKLAGESLYKKLPAEKQLEVLKAVYSYANSVAKNDMFDIEMSDTNSSAKKAVDGGISAGVYFMLKKAADTDDTDSVSQKEAKAVLDASDLTQKEKALMWTLFNKSWKNNPYGTYKLY